MFSLLDPLCGRYSVRGGSAHCCEGLWFLCMHKSRHKKLNISLLSYLEQIFWKILKFLQKNHLSSKNLRPNVGEGGKARFGRWDILLSNIMCVYPPPELFFTKASFIMLCQKNLMWVTKIDQIVFFNQFFVFEIGESVNQVHYWNFPGYGVVG